MSQSFAAFAVAAGIVGIAVIADIAAVVAIAVGDPKRLDLLVVWVTMVLRFADHISHEC